MYDSEEEPLVSLMNRDCNVNTTDDDDDDDGGYLPNFKTLARKKHKSTFVESSRTDELTPLHISVIEGFSDVAKYLIDKQGADVNRPDEILQFTPLHLAIYQHRRDLFQLLMDKGADVDGSGKDNLTPLHLSSMLGCPHFTEALINHGANVNQRYSDDRLTPLHLATIKSHLDNDELITAVRHGNEKSLIVKLMDHPYDPISQDYLAVIRLLLANGADVDATTTNGWNSLHYALKNNNLTLVEVFMEAGADVNAPSKDGRSSLHLALECNCTEILRLLKERGAELNCKGTRCLYTLLYVIARNNDDEDSIDGFYKTPLLLAISSLESREIKRAATCLCAIVDATNQVGCMPVNSEIQSDYADSSRSLRINRVNVHDSEVYAKFACDRVLSGALEELGYDRSEMRNPRYVYDYLSMMNAVKLPLVGNHMTSRTQSIADMYSHNKLKTHYESCLEEVEKMKSFVVNERRDVTLYEVLHMRPKRRRCYTKNLDLCRIQSEFVIYHKLIMAKYREDIVKRALMDAARLALFAFVGMDLPIICVEEIFADLGVMNMIAMIQAAEMID